MSHRVMLLLVVAVLVLPACTPADPAQLTEQAHQTATAMTQIDMSTQAATAESVPAGPTPLAGDGPWALLYPAGDGTLLDGVVYGQGPNCLVLAPMYPGAKEGWLTFAAAAGLQGYRSLTFDFRGRGDSEGDIDVSLAPDDLAGSIAVLKQNGCTQFVLIGAGIGSMAAIKTAPQDVSVKGVVVISGPRSFDTLEVTDSDLSAITVPSLWLAARNDMTQSVEEMSALAGSSNKTLWIYEGSSVQGTYILEGADGPDLQKRLLEFIASVFAV